MGQPPAVPIGRPTGKLAGMGTDGPAIEAVYGVSDETPLVMLFAGASGPQFGEVRYEGERLMIELFADRHSSPILLPDKELENVLRLARETLCDGDGGRLA
jgi:hypothetical protein